MLNFFVNLHHKLARRSCQGFTLIELLVVVTIIVAAALFVIPNIRAQRQRQALKTATDQLVAELRSVQTNALTGVRCGQYIDVTAGTWDLMFVDEQNYKKMPTCLNGTNDPTVLYTINPEINIKAIDIPPTCNERANYGGFGVKFSNIHGVAEFVAPAHCINTGTLMNITLQVIADPSQTMIITITKAGEGTGANIYAN